MHWRRDHESKRKRLLRVKGIIGREAYRGEKPIGGNTKYGNPALQGES